jgi:pimeloyl-ACP methyl ester carboxylesterase
MTQLHHMDHPSGGTGLPLLLLHGFTGAGDDFRHLFDLAALRSDRRVVVPDLLGHGQTGGPMPPLIHRESARSVIELLDNLGIDRCLAIGCSLGGNTLLHVATMAPTRIAAMVVVAATPYFPEQARAVMREQPVSRFMAEHHDDMNFTPPLLATIQAPTLIVNGDRDPLYPVELSIQLYRAIPRSALWIIPEAGHGPVWGEHGPAFRDRALSFLVAAVTPQEPLARPGR